MPGTNLFDKFSREDEGSSNLVVPEDTSGSMASPTPKPVNLFDKWSGEEPPTPDKQLQDTVRASHDAEIIPQEARKTLEAAQHFNVDPGVAKHLVKDKSFDDYWKLAMDTSSVSPKMAEWMRGSPENSAAVLDNLNKHQARERIMGNLDTFSRISADILSGANGVLGGFRYGDRWLKSRLDKIGGELFPGSFLDRPIDLPEEDSLYKFFKENKEAFKTDPMDASLKEVWNVHDPIVAANWLASQTAYQLPQVVPAMLSGPIGLTSMFVSTFGQNLEESDETKVSDWAKLVDATFSSAVEVGLEKATLGSQVKLEGTLRKVLGDKKFAQVMASAAKNIKEMGGELGKLFAKEIGGEMATEGLQSASDYMTGIDPNAMKDIGWKMAHAGVVAAGMTGGVRSPIVVAKALKAATSKYNTMQQQKAYDKLTGSDMRTELETDAPSVAKTLFQHQLDKKSLLIPKEKFDTILTEQGMDPAQVAKELGATQSFNSATTGSDVRIDTAAWIVKFGGTPTAAAFREHFTWNPMVRTAEEQKTDAEVETEEEGETADAMKGVEEQLTSVLPKKSHVKLFSSLISSWAETRAARMGTTVDQVLGKANLKIEKVTGVDPARFLEGMTAHPQLGKTIKEKEVGLKFAEQVNTPEFDSAFVATNKNVISPALIQNYSEDYKADPAEHFYATLDVAKKKAIRMFKERLANIPEKHVTINSGAQSSGSNDVLTGRKGATSAKDGLVLDIPMTSFEQADALIQAALSSGNKVQFVYTYKNLGIAASEHRREVANGAPLYPVDQFVLDHINTLKTATELAEKYEGNPNINIELQVYRGGLPQEATLEELKELRYGFPEETVQAVFTRFRKIAGGILKDAERQAIQTREWASRGDIPRGPGGTGVPEEGAEASWETYGVNSLEEAARVAERAASTGLAGAHKPRPKKPLTQKGRVIQGAYQTKDGKSFIYLFADSNFSTLVHELMHFFHHEAILDYQALMQVPEADRSPADQRFVDDMDILAKDMGAPSFLDMKEEHMEKLARAFETYAAEGKAPSKKLEAAFHTFKNWMLAIYRRITEIGSPIDDSTRAVFDRWLATSQEIDEAQAETNPIAPSILAGIPLPSKAAKKLSDAIASARSKAELKLADKTQMAYTRAFNRDQKELRAEIKSQVQSEADASGTYQRMDKLASMPDNSRIGKAFLDAELLKSIPKELTSDEGFDPEAIASILGYNTASDMLADFSSVKPKDQFIEEETERRYKELGHSVMQPSEQLREIARDIVNSEEKDKVYREELRILATEDLSSLKKIIRKVTSVPKSTPDLLIQADNIIESLAVNELNPTEYIRAERNARALAGKLLTQGDLEGCFQAVQDSRLHAMCFKKATQAKRSLVDRGKKTFAAVLKYSPKDSKRRDADLVMAAKAVLAKWGMGRGGQDPLTYMGKLATYNKPMYDLISAFVQNKVPVEQPQGFNLTPLEMPLRDFRKLYEAVGALWEMSDKFREVELGGRKLRVEDLGKQCAETIAKITPEQEKSGTYNPVKDTRAHFRDLVVSYVAKNTQARTMCKWLDGKTGGFFYQTLVLPVNEAALSFREAFGVGTKELTPLEDKLRSYQDKRTIDAPELICLDKESKFYGKSPVFRSTLELLGWAIHYYGNKSNRDKMLAGQGWAVIDEATQQLDTTKADAFFKRMVTEGILTQEHFEVMQTLGKSFGKVLPKMQEAKHKIDGYYMTEIPLVPFEAAGKTWEGWYVPIIYDSSDPRNSSIGKTEEGPAKVSDDLATMRTQDSFNMMTPCKGLDGMTFSRTGYTGPLNTDLSMYLSALDKCYRYAYIGPTVAEVSKLLANDEFSSPIENYSTSIIKNVFKPFLKAAITQSNETQTSHYAGVMRYAKEATSMLYMMGNIYNAAVQVTGITPALAVVSTKRALGSGAITLKHLTRIGTKKSLEYVGAERARVALAGLLTGTGLTPERINELSKFMRVLADNSAQERETNTANFLKGRGKFSKAQAFMRSNMYFLQSITQNFTNYTLWRARFEQELEKDPDMDRAIMEADNMIAETQGTSFAEDLTELERGDALWRAIGMFGRYWATQMNFVFSEIAMAHRDNPKKREALARTSYVLFTSIICTSLLSDGLMSLKSTGDDDKDKEGRTDWSWQSFLARLVYSPLNYSTGLLPVGLRQVAQFGFRATAAGNLEKVASGVERRALGGDRVQITPIIGLVERLTRSVKKDVSDITHGRPVDTMKITKDVADIATIATMLPIGPVVRQSEWAVNTVKGAMK